MKRKISTGRCVISLLFSVCFIAGLEGLAQQSVSKADQRPYSLSLTAKFHSTGHSPYSGVYLNHHPNAEVSLSWKYKHVGAFFGKNVDFADAHSPVNFSTAGVYRSFQVSKSFKLTPYIGCFLNQARSLIDDGSDMWAALVVKATVNKWVFIENTSLVGNLLANPSAASLANRINVSAGVGKFKLDAFAWYAHSFNSTLHFVSASLAITSPDWILTRSLSMRLQVAMLQHVSDEKPDGAMYRGGLISLICPLNLSPNE